MGGVTATIRLNLSGYFIIYKLVVSKASGLVVLKPVMSMDVPSIVYPGEYHGCSTQAQTEQRSAPEALSFSNCLVKALSLAHCNTKKVF